MMAQINIINDTGSGGYGSPFPNCSLLYLFMAHLLGAGVYADEVCGS